MGMKVTSKSAVVQRKLIASKKFSVIGKLNESNLIAGFEVDVKGKVTWVPVHAGNYLGAWIKVYKLIKSVL